MDMMVPLALFGWIPVVLMMFAALPPRRAVILAFLLGWMFLPVAGYELSGLPDYTKVSATSLGILLGATLFDLNRLLSFRPRWLDVPMLVWCVCPFASSIANGLGPYDGVSATVAQIIKWGLPYFIGRVYLRNLQDLRELAVWLFVGGLIYVPFCLWEVRMSPQLNRWVYGFGGTGISYLSEFGVFGSRPRVFMANGLSLGMFMTAATLAGIWLWRAGSLKRLWGLPVGPQVLLLATTTVLCKNVGALAVLCFGLGALFGSRRLRMSLPVYILIAAVPTYMAVRATGQWSGDALVNFVSQIHERRASSLQTRLDMEDLLVEKAWRRPITGWGGWGRWRVFNESGRDITLPDGLWVIAFSSTGLVGLSGLTAALLLPAVQFTRRFPVRNWLHPAIAPGGVLTVLLVVFMIDCLFNAFLNPIYVVAAGGLVCVSSGRAPILADPRRAVAVKSARCRTENVPRAVPVSGRQEGVWR